MFHKTNKYSKTCKVSKHIYKLTRFVTKVLSNIEELSSNFFILNEIGS